MAKRVKLSKAQQKVLDEAKAEIARARRYETYEEYFMAEEASRFNNAYNTPEKFWAKDPEKWRWYEQYWKDQTQGIVRIYAKVETTKKLEALGLVEILELNRGYISDKVRVIE
jgi:hypothetical protein